MEVKKMNELTNKLYFKGLEFKAKVLKLCKNESGETNIIAIILILAIVIALAIIFRNSLTSLFTKIWNSIFTSVDPLL